MISIVVPCYNCEKTFERCINSIRNQTYQEIQIILVDDGSTDSTGQLCEDAAGADGRIKVIHQKNGGLMNAWKNGVRNASGEYVAFCDSDDYIDVDLMEKMADKITECHADIILYGIQVEYVNGAVNLRDNRLREGLYAEREIEKIILPDYFDNGQMESLLILASRYSKIFRRALLMKMIDYLSDEISLGEDDATTFAAVLSAESICCMNGYYPYHYMRNDESMIGRYDPKMFDKFLMLRKQLIEIAKRYHYPYMEQIEKAFVSNVLLCMKKEISRNWRCGYRKVKQNLIRMRNNPVFTNALSNVSFDKYELKSRVFANLVIKRRYLALYVATSILARFGVGKP